MATIAKMVVGMELDPQGFNASLDASMARYTKFLNSLDAAVKNNKLAMPFDNLDQHAEAATAALLNILRRDFERAGVASKEALFRGLIDKAQYQEQGRLAAAAYNRGLTQGMDQLNSRGLLTNASRASIVGQFKTVGLTAGAAMSTAVKTEAVAAEVAVGGLGAAFTGLGGRGRSVFNNLAFNADRFVATATSAEGATRRLGRSFGILAESFGPEGFIIAGLVAAGVAVFEFWHRAQKAAEDAIKKMKEEIAGLVNSTDVIGLQKKMSALQFGLPDAGVAGRDPLGRTYFKDSITDIITRINDMNRRIKAGEDNPFLNLAGQVDALREKLKPMREQFDLLRDAMNRVGESNPEIALARVVTVTAAGPKKAAADATKAAREQAEAQEKVVKSANATVTAWLQLSAAHSDMKKANASLEASFKSLNDLLTHADPMSQLADNARKALHNVQAVSLLKDMNFNAPVWEQGHGFVEPNQIIEIRQDLASMLKDIPVTIEFEQPRPNSKEIRDAINFVRRSIESPLEQSLDVYSGIAKDVREVGDAFGGLGRSADQALSGVIGIASAVKQMEEAKRAGTFDFLAELSGVGGIVAGGISILSSLFGGGKSAAEQAREQIVRDNTDAIRKLSDNVRGLNSTPASLASVGLAVSQALDAARAGGVSGVQGVGTTFLDYTLQSLKRLGLTMDDLKRAAESAGITLFDSAGKLIPQALFQLQDALKLTVTSLTQFGKSFDDQQKRISLREELFGATPAQKLQDQLDAMQKFAPDLFKQFLGGANANTAAGRAAIAEGLRNIFNLIDKNALTPELLGSFTSLDELIDAISKTNGALGDLGSAANSVTEALTNVPTGFKIALARFNAQDARPSDLISAGGGTMYVHNGNVTVVAGDRDPEQLWNDIVTVGSQKARAQVGPSAHWSQAR